MKNLGESLLVSSGDKFTRDVQQTLAKLNAKYNRLDKLWSSRNRRLQQGLELQKLNMEADRIDATISGHEARLMIKYLGVSFALLRSWIWNTGLLFIINFADPNQFNVSQLMMMFFVGRTLWTACIVYLDDKRSWSVCLELWISESEPFKTGARSSLTNVTLHQSSEDETAFFNFLVFSLTVLIILFSVRSISGFSSDLGPLKNETGNLKKTVNRKDWSYLPPENIRYCWVWCRQNN